MTTAEQDEQKRVFVDLCTSVLHGSNAAGLLKVLQANQGWRNGLEKHILSCAVCQRILTAGK